MRKIETMMRLRIILSESDTYKERPLYEEIVVHVQLARLAGATVFRGCLGFNKTSGLTMKKILHTSKDIPVVIEILDSESKINSFFDVLEQLLTGGVATVEPVLLHRYGRDRIAMPLRKPREVMGDHNQRHLHASNV